MESVQITQQDIRKIGIVVRNFGASQLAFAAINGINNFLNNNPTYDVMGFCEYFLQSCIPAKFACFRHEEMWSFDGPLIATNLSTAQAVLKAPTRGRKFLYCWDLEWMRLPQKQWESLCGIYCDPNLELISRHKEHQKMLSQMWNKPVGLVEDFNLDELVKICESH